jgi:hypothetical protein
MATTAIESGQRKPLTERIRLSLTNEGRIYIIILLFVAAGGILRNINLLILLNGLMLAPLFIGWRLSVATLRSISARRIAPRVAFVNQPASVSWEIRNGRRSLASWQLVIQESCRRLHPEKSTAASSAPAGVAFPIVRPRATEFQHYRIRFETRGVYELDAASISSRFPFGIIQAQMSIGGTDRIHVAPPVGRLRASWDRRLLSRAVGAASIRRRRDLQDDEFFALRTWRSGDSLRQIHWRSTAKMQTPMVKQNDTRTDKDFMLVLDLFQPPGTLTPEVSERIETALEFASTVMVGIQNALLGQITVAICGDTTDIRSDHIYTRIAPEVFRALAKVHGTTQPETLSRISELGKAASAGTPLYVISTREFPRDELNSLSEESRTAFQSIEPWLHWVKTDSSTLQEIFQRHSEMEEE